MSKLLQSAYYLAIIIVMLAVPIYSSSCPSYCKQCSEQLSPSMFTCTKCYTNEQNYPDYQQYLWSCQQLMGNKGIFVGFCVAIVLLHLFMLSMGFGVYSLIYEQIQIISILLWVGIEYNGVYALQGTNFGLEIQNNFVRTYGIQFIIILFMLSVFFFLVVATLRIPHNPTAVLIRRKRAIFPVRIITLTYNMLLFSSLTSVVSVHNLQTIDIFELFLSILGLILASVIFVGVFFLCNFKKFKLDDPNYYVVCEKMLSVRWWVKNKLFFQITNNTIIICTFVFGFSNAASSIIVIMVFQGIFTLYLFIFIQYTKLRYKINLLISSLLFQAILLTINGLITKVDSIYKNFEVAYTILVVALCSLFLWATITEILAQRYKIGRQLRSFKNRFILCDQIDKDVKLNSYDSHGHRERVTEFQDNQIYGCDLTGVREKLNNPKNLEFA